MCCRERNRSGVYVHSTDQKCETGLTVGSGFVWGLLFAVGVCFAFRLDTYDATETTVTSSSFEEVNRYAVWGVMLFSLGAFMCPLLFIGIIALRRHKDSPSDYGGFAEEEDEEKNCRTFCRPLKSLGVPQIVIGMASGLLSGFGMIFGFGVHTYGRMPIGGFLMVASIAGVLGTMILRSCYYAWQKQEMGSGVYYHK